jgi:uncharacterized protein YecE (DUF72 family)
MSAFDLYQQHRMRRTDQRITANENNNDHRYRRTRDEIDQLHARIDRLAIITEAMWQLLAENVGLDEAELADKVQQLDGLDGTQDGRRQPRTSDCACGAKVTTKSEICQFCGAQAPKGSVFDAI